MFPLNFLAPKFQSSQSNMTTLPPRRNFNPAKTARYGRGKPLPPDVLVKYSPKWQYSRLMEFPFRGSFFRPRMRSVVVAVDGATRGNHDSDIESKSAWGVFFGRGCAFNRSGLGVEKGLKSGGAELEAVRQGLRAVLARRQAGEIDGFREIIVKLDSDYVAKAFDQWIWGWEQNGWKRSGGQPIKNLEVIKEIHNMICAMEADRMAVRFWRVDREWNADADALANEALDAESDSGYEEA